jgi:hypothetical protein
MTKSYKKSRKRSYKKSKKTKKYKLRSLKGYGSCIRNTSKKYITRNSPPYSANKCCNETKKGNDGNLYISKPNKNNICKWIKPNKKSSSRRRSGFKHRKSSSRRRRGFKHRKSRALYSYNKMIYNYKLNSKINENKDHYNKNVKQTLLNKNVNIKNEDIVMYTTSHGGGDMFNVYIIPKYNYAIITIYHYFFSEDQDINGNPFVKLNKNNLIENIKNQINTDGIIIDDIISVDPPSKNKKTRYYDRFPGFKSYILRITYNKLFRNKLGGSVLFELNNNYNYEYLYICGSIYKFNSMDINKDMSKITHYFCNQLDYDYAVSNNYIYLLSENSVIPKLNYEMWIKENNYSNDETDPYGYFYSMTENRQMKSTKEFISLYQNNLDYKMIFDLYWYH